jgi:hypothetical protein
MLKILSGRMNKKAAAGAALVPKGIETGEVKLLLR